jgi:hypothetical protein
MSDELIKYDDNALVCKKEGGLAYATCHPCAEQLIAQLRKALAEIAKIADSNKSAPRSRLMEIQNIATRHKQAK